MKPRLNVTLKVCFFWDKCAHLLSWWRRHGAGEVSLVRGQSATAWCQMSGVDGGKSVWIDPIVLPHRGGEGVSSVVLLQPHLLSESLMRWCCSAEGNAAWQDLSRSQHCCTLMRMCTWSQLSQRKEKKPWLHFYNACVCMYGFISAFTLQNSARNKLNWNNF